MTEIKESLSFASRSLWVNKLRTFLSLLGVTIGIFAIIMVFSLVDSMEANLRSMVSQIGDDLIMIEKWPLGPEEGENEYPWWKYYQRPEPTLKDMKLLKSRMNSAQDVAFRTEIQREIRYGNNVIEQGLMLLCSQSMETVYPFTLSEGRFFTKGEEQMAKPVCLIGYDVAQNLFGPISPLGREIKLGGRKATVIGMFEREGESLLGDNIDDIAMVPVSFGRQLVDLRETGNTILVKAKSGVTTLALKDEVIGVMRGIRMLRPQEEKDFAINEMSMITNLLDGIFGFFKTVGFVIGFFSILVGGFGIANIMFVSVKERTKIIGIQKALGAKQPFILLQFLIESIALSLIGGVLALVIVYILTIVASKSAGIEIFLSLTNISIGIGIALVIGILAGLIPAWQASKLDPVVAIRSS